jgi:hypothetical protein
MRWNTVEISKLLSPHCRSIAPCAPGGDVDTTGLVCTPVGDGDPIYVSGFCTSNFEVWKTPDDIEIDMVEVSDGQDSDGGLSSMNEYTCVLYARIVAALRNAGFDVVRQMKAYF